MMSAYPSEWMKFNLFNNVKKRSFQNDTFGWFTFLKKKKDLIN